MKIFRAGYVYHKAGVMLLNLVSASKVQGNLFDGLDRDKMGAMMKMLDSVNSLHGSGALRYAAEGLRPRWRMKQEYKSQRFTTCWSELAEVKAT